MDKQQAIDLVKETFESPFERGRFIKFVKNLLNEFDDEDARINQGSRIPESFRDYVEKFERVGKYTTEDKQIMLFIVHLKKEASIERARTMQRNLISWYLTHGSESKDAALVAFVSPNGDDWRFSLVKLDVRLEADGKGGMKVVDEFTPAKRWSFLVGSHEKSHTAQRQFQPILADDENNPTLEKLEAAFNIEKVTDEFFKEYRRLFIETKEALDKAVKGNPATKSDFESKGIDAVNLAKKLLGQIIFLYYLQKKGWFGVPRDGAWGEGSKNFLRDLFAKRRDNENFFNDILEHLFYDALRNDRSHDDHYYGRFNCKIPFLNGGLFDPMNNYDWVKTDILLPSELFSNKNKTKEGDEGDGILDVFDRYNFTVKEDEPFEKEVAIDPELLGKAYEKFNAIRPDNYEEFLKALKSGKKGEESKFNKQYGVYYTPREIVHYMCRQSLINFLYSELNPEAISRLTDGSDPKEIASLDVSRLARNDMPTKEAIALLIEHGESLREHEAQAAEKETKTYSPVIHESIRKNAVLIDRKLADIKICDPAVGSGAFPVGMMSEIVRAREVLKTWTRTTKTAYDFKRECIENSLYGVDIDAGAVEIAKLRLWLSLIVDEDDIQNIKPLPNLDYKIVCGNSLVGFPENWGSPIEKEIEALIHQHFNETNVSKKNELKIQIDEKIKSRYENSLKAFGYQVNFDFKTVFSEVFQRKGGFDVVIANPPYVRQEEIKELKPTLQKQFECYTGTSDLFVYFFEKGVRLLRENGILTFISSNKYFRSGYGEKLRAYLGTKTRILQVIDFGDAPIFDAIAYPSILVTQKAASNGNTFSALAWKLNEPLERFHETLVTQTITMRQTDLAPNGWRLENQSVLNLLEKLRKAGKPLGEYVNGRLYYGIKTGFNEAFVVDRATRDRLVAEHPSSAEVLKPFLRGRDVKRWKVDFGEQYLIKIESSENKKHAWSGKSEKEAEKVFAKTFPAIHTRFEEFREQLIKRDDQGKYFWELRSCVYWQEFEQPKIIYPDIAKGPEFAFDDNQYHLVNTLYLMPTDQKWLLGLLNSQAVFWFYAKTSSQIRGGFVRFIAQYVSQIPVPVNSDPKPIESLVGQILAAKAKDPTADVSALEGEIDQLVYQLYGLTEEEIGIVEGKGTPPRSPSF